MGGLIKQKDYNIENGIPILKDIPIIGYFFKSKAKELEVTETVILLRASIITPTISEQSDKDFAKEFTTDPRIFFNKIKFEKMRPIIRYIILTASRDWFLSWARNAYFDFWLYIIIFRISSHYRTALNQIAFFWWIRELL